MKPIWQIFSASQIVKMMIVVLVMCLFGLWGAQVGIVAGYFATTSIFSFVLSRLGLAIVWGVPSTIASFCLLGREMTFGEPSTPVAKFLYHIWPISLPLMAIFLSQVLIWVAPTAYQGLIATIVLIKML